MNRDSLVFLFGRCGCYLERLSRQNFPGGHGTGSKDIDIICVDKSGFGLAVQRLLLSMIFRFLFSVKKNAKYPYIDQTAVITATHNAPRPTR